MQYTIEIASHPPDILMVQHQMSLAMCTIYYCSSTDVTSLEGTGTFLFRCPCMVSDLLGRCLQDEPRPSTA